MSKRYSVAIIVGLSIVVLFSCYSTPPVSGFTIVEPNPGTIYLPGDSVTLRATTGPNEYPVTVYLHSRQMQYSDIYSAAPYVLTFAIPTEFIGNDTLVATAKFADGTIIEKEVQIQVVLPTNIVLKEITIAPNPVFLYKMTQNSDPNDIRIFENKSMGVGGIYSDGVQRNITSSTDGTTYVSGNENVVTVNSEGKVTAQGSGTTTITVRNGKCNATVKVVVKPYK
jgi:hypothetical protein